jgi:regulator of replication initiation timing
MRTKPLATLESLKDSLERLFEKIDELKHETGILTQRLGEFGTLPHFLDEKTKEPRVALREVAHQRQRLA